MNLSQDLSGSLSYISCFTIYISLHDNPKYTLREVVVYHYRFLSSKAYQNRYQTMAINPGGSRSISWFVDIEVLGLGSRILRPGSSFQTMPKNSGKERKSLCLTKPKLSISSLHLLSNAVASIYYVLTLLQTILHLFWFSQMKRAKACFYCICWNQQRWHI